MTKGGLRGGWAPESLVTIDLSTVGTGDGDSLVGGLIRSCRGVLRDVHSGNGRRCRCRHGSGSEAALVHLGSSRWSFGGRSLELEAGLLGSELRLGLSKLCAGREGVLVDLVDGGKALVGSGRVAGRHGVGAEGGRLGGEAGSVGSRLAAELGEVEVGSGAVSHIHGLEQTSLGVVTVEDDAVEENAEDLDHHLNDDADHGPVLETTDECIVNLVAKDFRTSVLHAGPTPHVLVVGVVLCVLEQDGRDNPEDQSQDELCDVSLCYST